MLTLCWAAKGGSGTTVVAAALALNHPPPTLLVDLDGDQPLALGVAHPVTPGVADWLATDAPAARLGGLEVAVGDTARLLPRGSHAAPADAPRWHDLARFLAEQPRHVVVDAGTRPPPAPLAALAAQRLLVVRNCYLNLRAATASAAAVAPTGVVLVEEPGRRLGADDIEAALAVPVVAVLLLDPAVARAADAGLLMSRLPSGLRRPLAPLGSHVPLGAAA
ncbi:MAG TPA: hypothetical protein VNQ73_19050 [Ilumatobacter sp.]|nr:hypothetical protein [Ilumatobacter sp.]